MQRMKGAIMWSLTVIAYFVFQMTINGTNLNQQLGDATVPLLLIAAATMAILTPLSLCTMFWEIKVKYDEEDEAGQELTWVQANRGIIIIAVGTILLPLIFILYPIGCIHLFFDIKRKYYN